jgi:hypothetical protein
MRPKISSILAWISFLIAALWTGAFSHAFCSANSPLQRPPTKPTIDVTFMDPPHFSLLFRAEDLLHFGPDVQR